ncbi:TPA: type VI secretion protein, partial [Enterococcus faecium]|nr:type VI secretion protein [Enterococcus faecium]
ADLMGTEEDIELTEMTTQEAGYSDMGKVDWTGERGTKRDVDRFKFNPNRIRALRTGEFVVYRTAEDVQEPPRVVYIRKPNLEKQYAK